MSPVKKLGGNSKIKTPWFLTNHLFLLLTPHLILWWALVKSKPSEAGGAGIRVQRERESWRFGIRGPSMWGAARTKAETATWKRVVLRNCLDSDLKHFYSDKALLKWECWGWRHSFHCCWGRLRISFLRGWLRKSSERLVLFAWCLLLLYSYAFIHLLLWHCLLYVCYIGLLFLYRKCLECESISKRGTLWNCLYSYCRLLVYYK